MVCPRCEQDYLCTFALPQTDESGLVCPDCDAVWPTDADVPYPGWADRSIFTEERGLEWGDMVVGPKTGEDPPPEGVNIHRRVRPRSGQRFVYVVGDMGEPRTPCAYCPSGNLVNAVLQTAGEKFLYCANCEAVWPTRDAVLKRPPMFLDTYLGSRNAEWAEVADARE